MKLGLSSTLITSEPCLASKSFEVQNSQPEMQPKGSFEGKRSNPRMLSSRSHRSLLESSPDGIIMGLANSTGSSSQVDFNSSIFLEDRK